MDKKKQRVIVCDEGLDNLRSAIVIQAVKDYEKLLKGTITPKSDCNISEIESFFRSAWFSTICDLDGEEIMSAVKQRVKKEKEPM